MKEIVKQNKLNKDVTQRKCSMEMTQFQFKLHNFTFLFGSSHNMMYNHMGTMLFSISNEWAFTDHRTFW